MKISTKTQDLANEIKMMKRIIIDNQKSIESYGCLHVGNQIMGYVIMPRYGISLEKHIEQYGFPNNLESLKVCLSVLEQLETVHRAGYIYNDLKPDNLLLNFRSSNI